MIRGQRQRKQKGFTIIEVLLFLTVSGIALAIAFSAFASTTENARVSDASRSLEAFLQHQMTRVQTGGFSNSRSNGNVGLPKNCFSTNDGQGDCLLVGLKLDFSKSTEIKVYPIFAKDVDLDNDGEFKNYYVASSAYETPDVHEIGWQATFSGKFFKSDKGKSSFQNMYIVRGYKDSNAKMYVGGADASFFAKGKMGTGVVLNPPVLICIKPQNSGLYGRTMIDVGREAKFINVSSISSSVGGGDEQVGNMKMSCSGKT